MFLAFKICMESKLLKVIIFKMLILFSFGSMGGTLTEADISCLDCSERSYAGGVLKLGKTVASATADFKSENANAIFRIAHQKSSSHEPISFRDGPNCFNAVLVGTGFVKEVTYTDPAELSFYLNKFCKRNDGAEKPGNILLITIDNYIEHAALSLPSGKIFEKNSSWGKYPDRNVGQQSFGNPAYMDEHLQSRDLSSRYTVKKKEESRYFNRLLNPLFRGPGIPERKTLSYECPSLDELSLELNRLNHQDQVVAIREINQDIEKVLFSDEKLPTFSARINLKIKSVIEKIKASKLSSEEELFITTKLISLRVQLGFLLGSLVAIPNADDVYKMSTDLQSLIDTLIKNQEKKPNKLSTEVLKTIAENS